MPLCPLCKRYISDGVRLMVFRAHGLVALAHDACNPMRPPADDAEVGDKRELDR
jgi:hypothetical protein